MSYLEWCAFTFSNESAFTASEAIFTSPLQTSGVLFNACGTAYGGDSSVIPNE
jgi:hypothetical protein